MKNDTCYACNFNVVLQYSCLIIKESVFLYLWVFILSAFFRWIKKHQVVPCRVLFTDLHSFRPHSLKSAVPLGDPWPWRLVQRSECRGQLLPFLYSLRRPEWLWTLTSWLTFWTCTGNESQVCFYGSRAVKDWQLAPQQLSVVEFIQYTTWMQFWNTWPFCKYSISCHAEGPGFVDKHSRWPQEAPKPELLCEVAVIDLVSHSQACLVISVKNGSNRPIEKQK